MVQEIGAPTMEIWLTRELAMLAVLSFNAADAWLLGARACA